MNDTNERVTIIREVNVHIYDKLYQIIIMKGKHKSDSFIAEYQRIHSSIGNVIDGGR